MRLICPKCDAQYEIDSALLPEGGCEVECSSCGHIWFQSQPAAEPSAEFNPEARPALNRALSESVLSVLREEAARELAAREADKVAVPPADERDTLPPAPPDSPIYTGRPHMEQRDPPMPPLPARKRKTVVQDGLSLPGDTLDTKGDEDFTPPPLKGPAEEPAPATPVIDTAVTDIPGLPVPVDRIPAPPAQPARSARSYRIGFGLALATAAVLAGLYLSAPHLPADGTIGSVAQQFRGDADRGRLWLQDRAERLISN